MPTQPLPLGMNVIATVSCELRFAHRSHNCRVIGGNGVERMLYAVRMQVNSTGPVITRGPTRGPAERLALAMESTYKINFQRCRLARRRRDVRDARDARDARDGRNASAGARERATDRERASARWRAGELESESWRGCVLEVRQGRNEGN